MGPRMVYSGGSVQALARLLHGRLLDGNVWFRDARCNGFALV